MERISCTRQVALLGLLTAVTGIASLGAETYEAPLARRKSADAKLTAGPAARPVKNGFEISFAVSAPVDVEVAILDAGGRIVRHLAAGLLGKHAPEPLRKGTLEQKLVWDGKDDAGKPLLGKAGARFSVRVRVGARPKLGKHLGYNPGRIERVRGLAVGSGGEVYALVMVGGKGSNDIRVFDSKGRYLRTILPYGAKTPAKRTKSVGQINVEGRRIPVVFNGHCHSLSPLTVAMPEQNMAWNPKGHLVAVSTLATSYEHGLPRHLLAFHPEGGAPEGMNFVGPELRAPTGISWGVGEGSVKCFEHLACSADGKYVYYTHSTHTNRHAVFRLRWGEDKGEGMEVGFLGKDCRPGSDDEHLNDPQGLAVDARGRIYVCDRGNHRVMVFSPEGKALGRIAVKDPEQIAVHPKTGAIYVACQQRDRRGPPKDTGPMPMSEYRAWKKRVAERWKKMPPKRPRALLKFSAFEPGKTPKQQIRLEKGFDLLALDPASEPARIWTVVRRHRIVPLTDRGDKFEFGEPINSKDGLKYPTYVTADPERKRVLIVDLGWKRTARALDLETGKTRQFVSGISEIALAPDGNFVASSRGYSRGLLRFDPQGKPLNWPGMKTHRAPTPKWSGLGHVFGQRGLCVGANGDIYFFRNGRGSGVQNRVDVYSPEGKLKKAAIIDGMGIGDCGLGVDAAGNIYVGSNVKPMKQILPGELKGVVPEVPWLCWAQNQWGYRPAPWYYSMRNEYLYHMGAVWKFPPSGGKFYGQCSFRVLPTPNLSPLTNAANAPENAPEYRTGYLMQRVKVVGAKWRCAGMGLMPASERQWGDPSCACISSRMDVDPYGRTFFPDCFRFGVKVIDSAGNLIAHVGEYGNADDRGPGIHFAWPACMDYGPDGPALRRRQRQRPADGGGVRVLRQGHLRPQGRSAVGDSVDAGTSLEHESAGLRTRTRTREAT